MQDIVNTLKTYAKDISVLYVEDNAGLRVQMQKFLKKFFPILYIAKDGEEGLELYKQHMAKIVITDVKMPKMGGLEMSKIIKEINPKTKIVVISAFDDKDKLYEAIGVGVYKYTKKPLEIKDFLKVMVKCIEDILQEERREVFDKYIKNIFNYQDNMIVLYEKDEPVIANLNFLEFFNVNTVQAFKEKYSDIGIKFEKVEGFLYSDKTNWLDKVKQDSKRLFNIKIKDKSGKYLHWILKAKEIPENKNQIILSFSDVTELGLLSILDKSSEQYTKNIPKSNITTLLKSIKDNDSEIKLLNFYKGLTIANNAKIKNVDENRLIIKTTYLQQKAIKLEGATIIVSDFLPRDIMCKNLEYIDFENGLVSVLDYSIIERSPRERAYVRVVPEEDHKAKMLYNGRLFEIKVIDISIKAAKIKIDALPAKMGIDTKVVLSLTMFLHYKPIHMQCLGHILRIEEKKYGYYIVVMFEINETEEKKLKEYVRNRQIALIREFKAL